MGYLLSELAAKFDLELRGQKEAVIKGVADLKNAGEGDVSFCADRRYLVALENSQATAVIISPGIAAEYQGNALLSDNPRLAFAKITRLLHPEVKKPAGIHSSAAIHAEAVIDETASVAENVTIEKAVKISAGCEIGAGCFIGENTSIDEGSVLKNNVTVHHDVVIGKRCILHTGSVIGSEGFGHVRDGQHWVAVPHLGGVRIGNDVRIGANSVVDRGALDDTQIGHGVKMDNLVHIAHNVQIGDDTALAACVGIAGSVRIGKRCTFAGQVGVVDNIEICDDAHFTGQSAVRSNITQPGVYSSGLLLEEQRSWSKNAARFKQLDTLFRQVRDLLKSKT